MSDQQDANVQVTREAAIIDAFVFLSDTLVADFDVIEFLNVLSERCVELSTADEAAVMLTSPSGHLQAVASSSERGRLLELFELQNEDGPCLDAFRSGQVVTSADLAHDRDRWPRFAPQAVDVGYRSVHSVPLKLREEIIGALNLLSVHEGRLSDLDARLIHALTDIATVGVLQERSISRSTSTAAALQTALDSRISIEQAKGVLAERSSLTIDEAFGVLRTYARQNQLRLSDVAVRVVNRTLNLPGGH